MYLSMYYYLAYIVANASENILTRFDRRWNNIIKNKSPKTFLYSKTENRKKSVVLLMLKQE